MLCPVVASCAACSPLLLVLSTPGAVSSDDASQVQHTPLTLACRLRSFEVAQTLMKYGAIATQQEVRIAAADRRSKDVFNLFVRDSSDSICACIIQLNGCTIKLYGCATCLQRPYHHFNALHDGFTQTRAPPLNICWSFARVQTPRPIENLFVTLTPVGRSERDCSMTLTWDYPYLTGNTDADIVEKFTILTSPFVGKKVREPAPRACLCIALLQSYRAHALLPRPPLRQAPLRSPLCARGARCASFE